MKVGASGHDHSVSRGQLEPLAALAAAIEPVVDLEALQALFLVAAKQRLGEVAEMMRVSQGRARARGLDELESLPHLQPRDGHVTGPAVVKKTIEGLTERANGAAVHQGLSDVRSPNDSRSCQDYLWVKVCTELGQSSVDFQSSLTASLSLPGQRFFDDFPVGGIGGLVGEDVHRVAVLDARNFHAAQCSGKRRLGRRIAFCGVVIGERKQLDLARCRPLGHEGRSQAAVRAGRVTVKLNPHELKLARSAIVAPMSTGNSSLLALSQERTRTIELLSDAFARDLLDLDTFESRVDQAHRAETVQALVALRQDIEPQASGETSTALATTSTEDQEALVAARPKSRWAVAILGGVERKGQWRVPKTVRAVAIMGGASLDFREAILAPGVTTVQVMALMGGVDIIVPPSLAVECDGFGLLGGFDSLERCPRIPDPNQPLLRIQGLGIMGGVSVSTRLPGESERQARKRLKRERKAQQDQLEAGDRKRLKS